MKRPRHSRAVWRSRTSGEKRRRNARPQRMSDHEEALVDEFLARLLAHGRSRVDSQKIWRDYAHVFPERAAAGGRDDLATLMGILAERALIGLPRTRKSWDRL